MHRRIFLGALALGAIGAFGAGAAIGDDFYTPPPPPLIPRAAGMPRLSPHPRPKPFALPPRFIPPMLERVSLPGATLHGLPGDGNLVALTVDDGGSSECVALYAQWCVDSGMRVTFFLNGSLPAWTDNAAALAPLVANGQVQLANHTWSHADLRQLSTGGIQDELLRNGDFIRDTYGVEAAPYYRPPFGYSDDRVRAAAAAVGYTQPVMWYGSLADSGLISDADLLQYANDWLLAQHIVIGHANWPTVTRHFEDLAGIIRSRGLVPVTLDDVFLRP